MHISIMNFLGTNAKFVQPKKTLITCKAEKDLTFKKMPIEQMGNRALINEIDVTYNSCALEVKDVLYRTTLESKQRALVALELKKKYRESLAMFKANEYKTFKDKNPKSELPSIQREMVTADRNYYGSLIAVASSAFVVGATPP